MTHPKQVLPPCSIWKTLIGFTLLLIARVSLGQDSFTPTVVSSTSPGRDQNRFLDQASIGFTVRIMNFDFLKGMNVEAGLVPRVESSYVDGFVTRYDKAYASIGGLAGNSVIKYVGENGLHAGLGPNYDIEFNYSRMYCSHRQAWLNYKFWENFPLNAERAQKKMRVGDHFSMRIRGGIMVGGGLLRSLVSHFNFDLNAYYLISGSFQVHVLRLPNDKIRFRLVSLDTSEKGVSLGIGRTDPLEIFDVTLIDKGITRVLDLRPIKLDYKQGDHDLIVAEYEINLLDPEAQKAYDSILMGSLELTGKLTKEFAQLKVGSIRERLKKTLLVNIEPLEKMAKSDLESHLQPARVIRNFKGEMQSKNKIWSYRLGIGLIQANSSSYQSNNEILSFKNEDLEVYNLDSSITRKENRFLYSVLRVQKDVIMNSISRVDEKSQDLRVEDYVVDVRSRLSRTGQMLNQEMREQLSRTLPESLFRQIDFSKWAGDGEVKNKVYIGYQVVFHPDVLKQTPVLSADQVEQRYLQYLRKLPNVENLINETRAASGFEDGGDRVKIKLGQDVERISEKIAHFLDQSQSETARFQALLRLKNQPLFLQTGVRFILELLPQDLSQLEKLVHVDLIMDSKRGGRVRFEFGNKKVSEIHNRFLLNQRLIDGGGLDLRLEGENLINSLTCEK